MPNFSLPAIYTRTLSEMIHDISTNPKAPESWGLHSWATISTAQGPLQEAVSFHPRPIPISTSPQRLKFKEMQCTWRWTSVAGGSLHQVQEDNTGANPGKVRGVVLSIYCFWHTVKYKLL